MDNKVHVFEKAGLGKAPFAYDHYYESKYVACQGAPVQPGTCCDYCMTGIMNVFVIRSADGKKFKVGSECVLKTDDAGLKSQINKARAELKHKRDSERIEAARARLADETIRAALAAQKHPRAGEMGNPYFDDKTMLDWALWMMSHAGNTGRLSVAKVIEKL